MKMDLYTICKKSGTEYEIFWTSDAEWWYLLFPDSSPHACAGTLYPPCEPRLSQNIALLSLCILLFLFMLKLGNSVD